MSEIKERIAAAIRRGGYRVGPSPWQGMATRVQAKATTSAAYAKRRAVAASMC